MTTIQRTFDDLGQPLHEVTFCVVDLETTGGSPRSHNITEVGAARFRGGVLLGTFQTLVNPGAPIPPQITVLTGITQAMVVPAPRIAHVLPSLLEFVGDSVIVGHNVRFDMGFLNAALARHDRPRLANPTVDTCALARRLVADQVPNCRLGTLADRFRLAHRPTHRALDDVLATADLLHLMLERAASLGVTGLDDLLSLPTIKAHPQASKLRLTEQLPRAPGVYLFRDRHDRVLYVGKATDLRQRVRSYFSSDTRRKIGQLLRETEHIDHVVCSGPLEAGVVEVRLIHRHNPRFNRQAKTWRAYSYLKLTRNERFPRLSVVKQARDDGALYLGPLPSTRMARQVAAAIESVVPIRRCSARIGARPSRAAPCAPAQLGVATCPCAGAISEDAYSVLVDRVACGLTTQPQVLVDPLVRRMHDLAAQDRFEEAAEVRNRADALTSAVRRHQARDALRRAGRLVVDDGTTGAEIEGGRLVRAWRLDAEPTLFTTDHHGDTLDPGQPVPRELADEIHTVAAWLDRHASVVRVHFSETGLALPHPCPAVLRPAKVSARPADR